MSFFLVKKIKYAILSKQQKRGKKMNNTNNINEKHIKMQCEIVNFIIMY